MSSLRQRSSRGVSLAYPAVLEVGFGLYLDYGLSIDNAVLIVTNVVSLLTTTTLVVAAVLAHGDESRRVALPGPVR